MIACIRVSVLALTLFVGCGGGTPTNGTTSSLTLSTQGTQEAPTQENPTILTTQSSDVSVNHCIDETLEALSMTKSTLTKLNCSKLTDRDFNLLSSLPSLEELTIMDTNLTATDVENIAVHINRAQMKSLILENDALTKKSIDKIDPDFTYDNRHYTTLQTLSLKNNNIEGLYMVDFFPNLESLDLSGNIYDAERLHHIGFIKALQSLKIGNNPTITNLNNLSDSPKAEASVKHIDITNMPNLRDISELTAFQVLETLTIDHVQAQQFSNTLSTLQANGVQILTR